MNEHNIQNSIRLAIADHGTFFRANAGQAWTGQTIDHTGSTITLKHPRRFHGLPAGFSDVFGITPVIVGPEHLGQMMGVFCAIEIKSAKGKTSALQNNFIKQVKMNGGRAGIARTDNEAIKIITKGNIL